MPVPLYQVDAFADRAFAGNPAAVCLREDLPDSAWMQHVAAEMNLSETAFLWPLDDGRWGLKWYTPGAEVKLCGHGTLSAAHVLWEMGLLDDDEPARFETLSGELTARRDGKVIAMDFPALPAAPVDPPAGLTEALGATPVAVGLTDEKYLVELADAHAVRALEPDFEALRSIGTPVIVTSTAETEHVDDRDIDVISRFFAPTLRVNEDPVTGSAHCVIGPWWFDRLGRDRLVCYQASPRGGIVHVQAAGDRVILSGQAVTVMRAELLATEAIRA